MVSTGGWYMTALHESDIVDKAGSAARLGIERPRRGQRTRERRLRDIVDKAGTAARLGIERPRRGQSNKRRRTRERQLR